MMGFDTLALASPSPSPDEEHEHARAIALLETALQAQPIGSREVLLLVGVEGLEHDEVATILGVSREAMRQRLSRAESVTDAATATASPSAWASSVTAPPPHRRPP